MAVTLQTILAEIKKNGKELSAVKAKLLIIEKKAVNLEKDMAKVLKCVSTENANFKIKPVRTFGGNKPVIPMAAKHN